MPESEKKIPLRKCICCRTMKPKAALLRVVKNKQGELSLDRSENGKLPGRGAYLCIEGDCIQTVRKKRGLERAFSSKIPDQIYDEMERGQHDTPILPTKHKSGG